MKKEFISFLLLAVSMILFIESKSQGDPPKKPPVTRPDGRPDVKPVSPSTENLNVTVKVTGMSEWDGMIGYDGVPEQTRVIQINLRTDPAAPGSARIGAALYFESRATTKVTYNPGNSLYIKYKLEDYLLVVPKLQKALSEGKDVWLDYSKTGSNSRFDIKISW